MTPDGKWAVALTQELIRRRTINPPGEEAACVDLLVPPLQAAGFTVSRHDLSPGRANIVARLDGDGDSPPLCFTGHLDTVPLGSAPWDCDPLGGDIDGDKLFGRGSSDMKSGVAAMVAAACRLARLPNRKAGLCLIFTASEETGCDGARHLASLDGVLPQAGALVVGEPTGNRPRIGHRGALWLRACFHGVTAHGSTPELGDNALHKAARGILDLADHRLSGEPHPALGNPSLNVGTLTGGLNVNSVPDRAELGLDIRMVPGQDGAAMIAELAGVLGEGVDIAPTVNVGAVATSLQNEWVSGVFDLCERTLGERLEPGPVPFFSDASVLVPAMGGIPALVLGPGETAMAHRTNEYCHVSKIEQAVALYDEIGRAWMEKA